MASATTTEENKRNVRRLTDALNEKNLDVFDELFAEDVIDHTPLGETRGRGAVKELTEHLHGAFSGFTVTIEDVIAEGDIVAVRGTERGTHEGEFMNIEPTGRQVEFELMEFARVEGGKIVERWVRPDMLALLTQLGGVEPPGER